MYLKTLPAKRMVPVLFIAACCVARPAQTADETRRPVFVGVQVCAQCHDGKGAGRQTTIWLQSKHAKAYASLAKPQAWEIARISGVPIQPQKSPLCLGCHATGADTEESDKDDTFSFRDGVQCEKCHGPGSEHVDVRAGAAHSARLVGDLANPSSADCMKCHKEKPSHTRILGPQSYDVTDALRKIAHPTPTDASGAKPTTLPKPPAMPPVTSDGTTVKYTGSAACAQCHDQPEKGLQFSKWQTSKHADAYAVLATDAAAKIAVDMGVQGDPRGNVACLKCHSTAFHRASGGVQPTYSPLEGVGCEACHGAGNDYATDEIMRDKAQAAKAGLRRVDRQTCLACHENAHGKPFDHEAALKAVAHPAEAPPPVHEVRYKTPINPAISRDGKELFVACEEAYTVCVIDTAARKKVAEIPVGGQPQSLTISPDGRKLYVTNRLDDTLGVIDVAQRKVIATVPVGDEPHGVATDSSGETIYVLNTSSNDISVIDARSLREVKRLSASRSPWAASLSPDGGKLYITNALSRFVKFQQPSVSEVTVIDTHRSVVEHRAAVPASNLLQGVAWHPSGKFALITLLRTKNLVPMTRMLQGWTVTNGLGILWADGRVDQILLDEPSRSFPDPIGIAFADGGRYALVTSSGSNRVAVVDVQKMLDIVEGASPYDRENVVPNHLGKATEFVVGHIPTKLNPRGIVVAPDGRTAYVACALDDAITVIDAIQRKAVAAIDLGGPKEITKARYGERLFNNANIAFRRQLSCHTCHPDGHVDGLTYDIESDGIGLNPVDNRTLRGILDTGPFKWDGTNATLSRQCGPRLSVFFTRIQPFTPTELDAVDHYISTIARPPNRYRPLGETLSPAQRRGKFLFDRAKSNDGREIPIQKRCVSCHFPPLYTDRNLHNVGTKHPLDSKAKFDVPHLNNIYDSAPYLHNGIADTLEEIWTKYNLNDEHGVTNDMTKDQLNDLIEYLKTL